MSSTPIDHKETVSAILLTRNDFRQAVGVLPKRRALRERPITGENEFTDNQRVEVTSAPINKADGTEAITIEVLKKGPKTRLPFNRYDAAREKNVIATIEATRIGNTVTVTKAAYFSDDGQVASRNLSFVWGVVKQAAQYNRDLTQDYQEIKAQDPSAHIPVIN